MKKNTILALTIGITSSVFAQQNTEVLIEKPKYIPAYDVSEPGQIRGRFFTVTGEVICAANTYAINNMVKQCAAKSCGEESCFIDIINQERQTKNFTPIINKSDAILFNNNIFSMENPRGGAASALNFFSGQRKLYYAELPGSAIKWTEPTEEDFKKILHGTDSVRHHDILRLNLMHIIRERKLTSHLPLLRHYLPEQTKEPLEKWARRSENWLAADIIIELNDPSAKGLTPYLEKLLRYSSIANTRISSAKLLLRLGAREIVESVAKEPSEIQKTLNSLLLNS